MRRRSGVGVIPPPSTHPCSSPASSNATRGLADRTRHLGEGLYVDGRLSPRARTIAILRTCALVGSAYEWGGQAAFWGPLTNVSPDEADRLARDRPFDAEHAG